MPAKLANAAAAMLRQWRRGGRTRGSNLAEESAMSTTTPAGSPRAISTNASIDIAGSLVAAARVRSSAATPRYSSMWMGEALIHARNAARSVSESGPARWAAYQSAATWVIAERICGSDACIRLPHSCHAPAAMRQAQTQVFLHHVRRYPQPIGDFLVTQAVLVFQVDRGSTLRRQLRQYFAQPYDPCLQVEQLLETG